MDSKLDTVARWIHDLHSGAPDRVVMAQEEIFRAYASSLRALVCQKLHPAAAKLEPPSAIANSALNDLFLNNRLKEVSDRDSLWRLLAEIVVCKTYNRNKHHLAQRRDARRTEPIHEHEALEGSIKLPHSTGSPSKRAYRKAINTESVAREPESAVNGETVELLTMGATPEHAAMLKETLVTLGELEPIARLFLLGYGKHEIAKRLNLSPKTVQRSFVRIGDALSRHRSDQ